MRQYNQDILLFPAANFEGSRFSRSVAGHYRVYGTQGLP